MLSLALPIEILLCAEPTDMRKGFDGLVGLAQTQLTRDVLAGGLFVFVNRRRDRLKLLYWDEDGLAIWHKRLEAGTFQLPAINADTRSVKLTAAELGLILRGIDLTSIRVRKRYRRPA